MGLWVSSSDSGNLGFFLNIWQVANASLELGPNHEPATALSVLSDLFNAHDSPLKEKIIHFNHLTHENTDPRDVVMETKGGLAHRPQVRSL